MKNFVIKGDICYSISDSELCCIKNGLVVCEDNRCSGVYEELPEKFSHFPVYDYSGKMIIPGLVDLHVHAPQYPFRGTAMDMELIDWLNTYTFAEEAKYSDPEYAECSYEIFADDLLHSATTRACIFATTHTDATLTLMDKLEQMGMKCFVGRVNMDRNCPDYLCEKSAAESVKDTESWILSCRKYDNVKPILTPRFTPSCTDELLEGLSVLQKKYGLPVQSHLSENPGEIEWVRELCPNAKNYGDSYGRYGLFGGGCPTVMAHCVYSDDDEIEAMRSSNVFVAHCPESNANLSSGVAPVGKYLEKGLKAGLGSDAAAGSSISIFRAMAMAIQCSKLRWRLYDSSVKPLTVENAFYLATKGGGEFFGKVGSFEKDYEFDAVVIDDSLIRSPREFTLRERLERLIYLAQDNHITAKFINGRMVL